MSPLSETPTEPVAGPSAPPPPDASQGAADGQPAGTPADPAAQGAASASADVAPAGVPAPAVADLSAELAAVAVAAISGGKACAVVDYDWQTPHHFTLGGLKKLNEFAATAATRISADLKELFRRDTRICAGPVAEQYGAHTWTPGRTPLYAVPLNDVSGAVAGMVGLTPTAAIGWVERLLGGTAKAAATVRPLSPLEAALLLDIVAAVVKAFTATLRQSGGEAIQHVEDVSHERSPLAGMDVEEFTRFNLSDIAGSSEPCAWLAVRSELLAPVAEPNALKKESQSVEDNHKDLRAHIEHVPVSVTARLGAATVTMRDIVSLEPDDVLILDKGLGDPIELIAMGKVLLYAIPVTCDGQYAVQVVERREEPRLKLTHKENEE
jgi:flagellar motor switch protein FliM